MILKRSPLKKKKQQTLDDLLVDQLRDLLDAEMRITVALPKMAKVASNRELRQGFKQHLVQTKEQVRRLENVFDMLGKKPKRRTCEGIKGLLREGEEYLKNKTMDDGVRDAGLIASAQRVEHYEMAGYGSVRAFAEQLGHLQAAKLLQETLEEESETDKRLSMLAENSVNAAAMGS